MDLILEGQLSAQSGIREVLQAVLKQTSEATGILRISCPGRNLNGRLALVNGQFIVGAQITDSEENGYDAVKQLLTVTEGNFAFLETDDNKSLDLGRTVHINLLLLIDRLPDLPDNPADLFDQQSLLDEVFGPNNQASNQQSSIDTMVLPREPAKPEKQMNGSNGNWQLLTPLMQEDALPSHRQAPILGSGALAPKPAVDSKSSSLSPALAALPEKRAVWPAVLAIAMLLALAAVGWLFWPKAPHEQSGQPTRKHGLVHGKRPVATLAPDRIARTARNLLKRSDRGAL
jgi:hypothetical protein